MLDSSANRTYDLTESTCRDGAPEGGPPASPGLPRTIAPAGSHGKETCRVSPLTSRALVLIPPSPAETEALARAAAYFQRAGTAAGSRLLCGTDVHNGTVFSTILRDQALACAALCQGLLDLFGEATRVATAEAHQRPPQSTDRLPSNGCHVDRGVAVSLSDASAKSAERNPRPRAQSAEAG